MRNFYRITPCVRYKGTRYYGSTLNQFLSHEELDKYKQPLKLNWDNIYVITYNHPLRLFESPVAIVVDDKQIRLYNPTVFHGHEYTIKKKDTPELELTLYYDIIPYTPTMSDILNNFSAEIAMEYIATRLKLYNYKGDLL
jgi:hypothetical protein